MFYFNLKQKNTVKAPSIARTTNRGRYNANLKAVSTNQMSQKPHINLWWQKRWTHFLLAVLGFRFGLKKIKCIISITIPHKDKCTKICVCVNMSVKMCVCVRLQIAYMSLMEMTWNTHHHSEMKETSTWLFFLSYTVEAPNGKNVFYHTGSVYMQNSRVSIIYTRCKRVFNTSTGAMQPPPRAAETQLSSLSLIQKLTVTLIFLDKLDAC